MKTFTRLAYYISYLPFFYQLCRRKCKAVSSRYSGQNLLMPAHPKDLLYLRNIQRQEIQKTIPLFQS